MAVTNLLTLIEDCEGTLGTITAIGGGAGATANTDIYIAGSQSIGRRSDNSATLHGTWLNAGATFDISGTDQHVKFWTFLTHYKSVTGLEYRFGSDTSNYKKLAFDINKIPTTGGWFPVWMDRNFFQGGTIVGSPNFTVIDEFAQAITIGDVGGNAQNNIFDQIHHGASAMRWDGTGGTFADFRTTEASNALGAFLTKDGIDYLYSRLEIGSATSTTFTDSNIILVYPDQPLCSTTFMGLTFDLQHASTSISITNSVITSGNPISAFRRGDLTVSGTSGALTLDGNTFNGLRLLTLNNKVSAKSCNFLNTGQITANGADLEGSVISGYEGTANTSSLVWNANFDPDGELDNCTFTKGTAATHAIELGTSAPTTITLRNVIFSGYNASNSQNDSTIHVKHTSGTVTINVVGGTPPTYRSDGAIVVIIINPVILAINVKDITDSSNVLGARTLVLAAAGGDLPANESVTITLDYLTATVTHSGHALSTGDKVLIKGSNDDIYNGIHTISGISADQYSFIVGGETTISGLTGRYDPDSNSNTLVGDHMSVLADLSGNGNTFSQSTDANRPVVVADPVLGRDVITFSGYYNGAQYMTQSAGDLINLLGTTNWSVVMETKTTQTAYYDEYYWLVPNYLSGDQQSYALYNYTISGINQLRAGYFDTGFGITVAHRPIYTPLFTGNWAYLGERKNATMHVVSFNNIEGTPTDISSYPTRYTPAGENAELGRGYPPGGTQNYYQGAIGRFATFNVTLTPEQVRVINRAFSAASPATGTITSTAVILHGTTDSNGNISVTRSFSADQPITGKVRRATTGTVYKPSVVSGTIDSQTGLNINIQLIRDT